MEVLADTAHTVFFMWIVSLEHVDTLTRLPPPPPVSSNSLNLLRNRRIKLRQRIVVRLQRRFIVVVVRFNEKPLQFLHQTDVLFVELRCHAVLNGSVQLVGVQRNPRMVQIEEFLTDDWQQRMTGRTSYDEIGQLVYGQWVAGTTLTSNDVSGFLWGEIKLIFRAQNPLKFIP